MDDLLNFFLGHRKRSHSNRSKSDTKNSRSRSRENSIKKHSLSENPKPVSLAPQAPPEPEPEPIKYLFFKKDDLIKATANAGSGWCYGGIVDNFAEMNKNPRIQGFFPQSYIQTLTSGETVAANEENVSDPANPTLSVEQQQKQAYQKYQNEKKKYLEKIGSYTEDQQTYSAHEVPGGYAGYAMNSFGNEETLTIEHRRKLLAKQLKEPEEKIGQGAAQAMANKYNKGPPGQGGDRGAGGDPKKGGQLTSDQSPLAKAYRQLNYYFDYENWNDNNNSRRPTKGKSDPKYKKKKKFHL